jgi:hypothetical protein
LRLYLRFWFHRKELQMAAQRQRICEPEIEMVPWTYFEMWRPCFPHGVHHYRIVFRGKSYDAEKNGKLIGQFAELGPAQRCIEASAQRAEAWRARRMARVMAKTRAVLAEEIRRDVPFERLFAAMFSVLQRRHERAGDGEFLEPNVSDPEQMLDTFLQTCTVRQVRMLREIALEAARGPAAVAPMRMRVPMRDA